jgi:hypothetical protein
MIKLLCSYEMPAYGPYETMMLYANNITLKPPIHFEPPKSHGTGLKSLNPKSFNPKMPLPLDPLTLRSL